MLAFPDPIPRVARLEGCGRATPDYTLGGFLLYPTALDLFDCKVGRGNSVRWVTPHTSYSELCISGTK